MALIKCTECGAEISDKSPACVKCGAPVQRPTATRAPAVATPSVLKQKLPAWQILAGLLLCLGMFWFFANLKTNDEPEKIVAAPQAAATPASPATPVTQDTPATNDPTVAFVKCLTVESRSSDYVSTDGGKSALRLIGACQAQWKAHIDACMAAGDTDSNCTVKSGILSQVAIKLHGR